MNRRIASKFLSQNHRGFTGDFVGFYGLLGPFEKENHRNFEVKRFGDTNSENQTKYYEVFLMKFCHNKSRFVPSCLVSSTFGCPQYPNIVTKNDVTVT